MGTIPITVDDLSIVDSIPDPSNIWHLIKKCDEMSRLPSNKSNKYSALANLSFETCSVLELLRSSSDLKMLGFTRALISQMCLAWWWFTPHEFKTL